MSRPSVVACHRLGLVSRPKSVVCFVDALCFGASLVYAFVVALAEVGDPVAEFADSDHVLPPLWLVAPRCHHPWISAGPRPPERLWLLRGWTTCVVQVEDAIHLRFDDGDCFVIVVESCASESCVEVSESVAVFGDAHRVSLMPRRARVVRSVWIQGRSIIGCPLSTTKAEGPCRSHSASREAYHTLGSLQVTWLYRNVCCGFERDR